MDVAIISDGGFVLRQIKRRLKISVENKSLAEIIHKWMTHDIPLALKEKTQKTVSLFRINHYDCFPYEGEILNPFSGYTRMVRADHRKDFLNHFSRLDRVSFQPGRLSLNGWKLKDFSGLVERSKQVPSKQFRVTANDFLPNFVQKKVDVQIVMDVVRLAQQGTIQAIVFLTADSDFVPAIKYAKDQGLLVYLMPLGRRVAQDLIMEVDGVLESKFDLLPDILGRNVSRI